MTGILFDNPVVCCPYLRALYYRVLRRSLKINPIDWGPKPKISLLSYLKVLSNSIELYKYSIRSHSS